MAEMILLCLSFLNKNKKAGDISNAVIATAIRYIPCFLSLQFLIACDCNFVKIDSVPVPRTQAGVMGCNASRNFVCLICFLPLYPE